MDYEYDHDDYGPRVLWGRLIFFAVALLLVFLMGRCVGVRAGSGGQDEELANRVMELSSDKAQLQQELAAALATQNQNNNNNNQNGDGGGGDGDGEAEPTEASTDGETDPLPSDGETYTVQSGDTLVTIARNFYGDAQKYQLIVDANNLDSTTLTVGQELIIPPEE